MLPRWRSIMLLVFLVCLTALLGCAGNSTSRSTGETLDDAAIASKVKTALLADEEVSGLQVDVEVFRGDVLLSGFVDRPTQVLRAGEIAREVSGVRSVRNSLIVK